MRAIMTCGGTGGHIYPAVAIADEIKRREPDSEILFVGSEIGLESKLVPESGYEIKVVTTGWFDRENLLNNINMYRAVRKGRRESAAIFRDFRPDVVIGTGGYASVPVMQEAQKERIPTYIHEQNAVPGVANKALEKKVKKLFLGFEEASKSFRYPARHVVSGNPVRREFVEADGAKAREELGFSPADFVVLAFGGSQGAGRINKAMMKVIEKAAAADDVRICLATGEYYYEAVMQELADKGIETGGRIMIMEYIRDMARYLASSDLVIGRSGALTVAEVTVCGKPAIFIPSPMVTGNHQYFNAKAVADKGGALIVEEKDLDGDALASEVMELKEDPARIREMAAASYACAPLKAVDIICDTVMGKK